MDEFFQFHPSSGFEEAPMEKQSAFRRYQSQPFEWLACHPNANKKMIEFLRKSWVAPPRIETFGEENDRSLKHRIMERMRRQKHKQSYLALHELLPPGTKNDKKSILEMAAKEIEELQHYKEKLRGENEKMEMIMSAWKNEKAVEKAEIKLKVDHPASGVDSMLEVLRCLKNNGCTATAIQSSFSQHEFAAAVEFETKMRAENVEEAVQGSLYEAEMKLRQQV